MLIAYSQREIRYDAREMLEWPSKVGPHQLTYDVLATLIRPTNA